jgi:hypothetical protein
VKNRLVLLLTGVGGYVDAVSYVALGRVFTANMTGNTVLLGLSLVQGDAAGAGRSALALGGFLAGGVLGARIVARGKRDGGADRRGRVAGDAGRRAHGGGDRRVEQSRSSAALAASQGLYNGFLAAGRFPR